VGAVCTQSNNSSSSNNNKGGGKKWHNSKKDGKQPTKAGKTKSQRGKPATTFEPIDPGRYLANKAWRALTEEQRTASREAHAQNLEQK
jgi:hypothetical protein